MRSDNMGADFVPPWRNIHLFRVANEEIGKRIAILFLSILKIAFHRRAFAGVDLIVARNFDMQLLPSPESSSPSGRAFPWSTSASTSTAASPAHRPRAPCSASSSG